MKKFLKTILLITAIYSLFIGLIFVLDHRITTLEKIEYSENN